MFKSLLTKTALIGGVIALATAASVRADINLAVSTAAGFIPQIWAQEALPILRANLVMANLIARDTGFDPFKVGSTLNIPFPGTLTAQRKTDTNLATVQTPVGGTTKQVTLNQLVYTDVIIDDYAEAQANGTLMKRWIEPAITTIAETVESDIMALYSTFTGGTTGTAGTNVTRATSTMPAMTALNTAKAPQADRSMVLSPKDWTAMIGDPTLAQYFAYSANQAINEGKIPHLDGFALYMSQLVPTVGNAPTTTQNIAFHKNAMIMAMRPLPKPPAESGAACEVITDPESGLSIRVVMQYDMDAKGVRVGFDILYGVAPLRPELGVNVKG